MKKLTRSEALQIAKGLKNDLRKNGKGLPVLNVILYGSAARDEADEQSDIDIVIVCDAFAPSRSKEIRAVRTASLDLDPRVELIVLHPEDLDNKYLTLAHEIKRDGIIA